MALLRPPEFRQVMMAPNALEATVSTVAGHAVVTVTGDLLYGTDQLLADQLARAFELTDTAVIVEMSGLDFCDSSGLAVFARAVRQARAGSVALLACGLTKRVHHVFTTTRMDQGVNLQPDLDAAVAWLEAHPQPPPA